MNEIISYDTYVRSFATAFAEEFQKGIKEYIMGRDRDSIRDFPVETTPKLKITLPKVEGHTFASGAKRSEYKPNYGYMPGDSIDLTAMRFEHGHGKYDPNDIYDDANWLAGVKRRDVKFVRQAFIHIKDHYWAEMRGMDDPDPGGNLGAIGWALEILAYVRKHDPELYAAARGLTELEVKNEAGS